MTKRSLSVSNSSWGCGPRITVKGFSDFSQLAKLWLVRLPSFTFPIAKLLVDYADSLGEFLLVESSAPAGHERKPGRCLQTIARIVAEECEDVRPSRNHRFSFVALPSFINLPNCAKLRGDLLLG